MDPTDFSKSGKSAHYAALIRGRGATPESGTQRDSILTRSVFQTCNKYSIFTILSCHATLIFGHPPPGMLVGKYIDNMGEKTSEITDVESILGEVSNTTYLVLAQLNYW